MYVGVDAQKGVSCFKKMTVISYCIFLLLLSVQALAELDLYLIVQSEEGYSKGITSRYPYANIEENDTFHGYLYYYDNITCDGSIYIPPPLIINETTINTPILLLYGHSDCILEKIFASLRAGYKMFLTYTYNDDDSTIKSEIRDTGVPIAIFEYSVIIKTLINIANSPNFTITIGLYDSSNGIAIDVTLFFIAICVIGIIMCVCINRSRSNDGQHQYDHQLSTNLESSLQSHLQSLEESQGAQRPLGSNAVKNLSKRTYKGNEQYDTCVICTDEFADNAFVTELSCEHVFHPLCIEKWLLDYSSVCPMCKCRAILPLHNNYATFV